MNKTESGILPVWFIWALASLGVVLVGGLVVYQVVDSGPDRPPIDLFVGPAPENLGPCEIGVAAAQGVEWTGEEDGWRSGDFPQPDLTGDYSVDRPAVEAWKSQMEVVVAATFAAVDGQCNGAASPTPSVSPSVSGEPTPVASASGSLVNAGLAGQYVTDEDEARRSTGTGDGVDPLGCAGRRVPTQISVAYTAGAIIQFTFIDTAGQPAFTGNGSFDPATGSFTLPYPDGAKELEGTFVVFAEKPEMRDVKLYSGDCTFFFGATKR